MSKSDELYGAVVTFGGFLLLIFGILLYPLGVMGQHCVPGWVVDHWRATVGLFVASGLGATLSGLCLMTDDRRYMALSSVLSMTSIIPAYGIQYSINEVVTNDDMAGPFLVAIMAIAVLSLVYPFYKGLTGELSKLQWNMLLTVAAAIAIVGAAMLPVSFNIIVGHNDDGTLRDTVHTLAYASAAYFAIVGAIVACHLRRGIAARSKHNL